jgi:hypothetical protein
MTPTPSSPRDQKPGISLPVTHLTGIIAATVALELAAFWAIAQWISTAALMRAVIVLGSFFAVFAIAVLAVDWVVGVTQRSRRPARLAHTPDADGQLFIVAFLVVVAVLGLGVRAWDHDQRWLDAPPAAQVADR